MREAIGWSAFYIALPLAFGAWIWSRYGSQQGVEYLTGYLVEKSLSVDNLFVFMLLLAAFAVPPVLPSGCCSTASPARWCCAAVFIALGAAASRRSTWRSCSSALVLVATGGKMLRDALSGHEQEVDINRMRVGEAAAPGHAGGRRVPRARMTVRRAGAGAHPVRPGGGRGARHRHRVRGRLGARGLRHHRGPVPGLRHQRVRAAGPAGALLRAEPRWAAAAPRLRPRRPSSGSSASSWACTGRTGPACRRSPPWPRSA